MADIDVCFSWDHLMIEISRRLGKNSILEFVAALKEQGKAWAYCGVMNGGRPMPKVFQVCKLDCGAYAFREGSYNSKEPSWNWVAMVGKMILPPGTPLSPFKSGYAIRAEHTGTVMIPLYARPDVQAGE